MANLVETNRWEQGIYQLESKDPVEGGVNGISNMQAKQLANRTQYLKDQINTKLSSANYTAADVRTKLKTLDGTGSGIDADLLDGQHGSYYRDAVNLNAGTVPAARLSGEYGDVVVAGNIGRKAAATKVTLRNQAAWRNLPVGWSGIVSSASVSLPTNHDYCFVKQSRSGTNGNAWTGILTRLDQVVVYFGRALASTSAWWLKISLDQDAVQPGTIIAWPGSNTPSRYLTCNGASYLKNQYARLFAAIGTTYGGAGDRFNIPDLRGEFIRGLSQSRNVDNGRRLGSSQSDAIKSHTHKYYSPHESLGGGTRAAGYYYNYGAGTSQSYLGQNANTGSSGATETRPRNVAMKYVIKY